MGDDFVCKKSSWVARDGGGSPPALSAYGKESVVLSDFLIAFFAKKDVAKLGEKLPRVPRC